MKNKIIEALEKDKRVKEILSYFIENFSKKYKELEKEEKESVLNSRDGIFRRWYYSTLIDDSTLNPAYLINQISQNNVDGEYVIMPHVSIQKDKSNKINFSVDYKYYSQKEHPVIEDLERVVEFCTPSRIIEENSPYIFEDGLDLVEQLNFRSGFYLKYLVNLCYELKLLKDMPSIACRCIQPHKNYDSFMELSNEEKLYDIFEISVELSCKEFNKNPIIATQISKKRIWEILDNGITRENYTKDLRENYEFLKNVIEDNGFEDRQSITEEEKEESINHASVIYYGLFFDMSVLSVFAYYLGIININYESTYEVGGEIEELLSFDDSIDKLSHLFVLDNYHDLTALGKKIINQYKEVNSHVNFKVMSDEEINDIVKEVKEEQEILSSDEFKNALSIIKNMKDEVHDDIEDEEFLGALDIDSDLNDLSDESIELLEGLNEFLYDDSSLKESLVDRYWEIIQEFLARYMEVNYEENIRMLNAIIIDDYIRNFYIEFYSGNVNSIKELMIAMRYYSEFLRAKDLISEKELEEIQKIYDNKECYIGLVKGKN